MSAVLDCPCCDGRNASGQKIFVPIVESDINGLWRVRCSQCGVQTATAYGSSAAAVSVWNNRPTVKQAAATFTDYYNAMTDKSVPASILKTVWEDAIASTKVQVPAGITVSV